MSPFPSAWRVGAPYIPPRTVFPDINEQSEYSMALILNIRRNSTKCKFITVWTVYVTILL